MQVAIIKLGSVPVKPVLDCKLVARSDSLFCGGVRTHTAANGEPVNHPDS